MSDSAGRPDLPTSAHPDRHLAAVWFADLVGYSTLAASDERAALRLVALLQATAREQIEHFRGRVVKFLGDGVFAEFGSTESAVRAALALQREFGARAAVEELPGALRIGVHVGDVASGPDGDLYGDGVNLAARLEAAAEPGEVLVSDSVRQHLRARSEFRFRALGQRALKGVSGPVALFAVGLAGEGGEPPASRGTAPPSPASRREDGRRRSLAVAALGLLALLVAGWLAWRSPAPRGTALDAPAQTAADSEYAASVAVLPFDYLGGGAENEYFSEGITDEIISELAKVEGLKVISRTSVVALKGARLTLPQIAETLDVRHVLEGSVRRAGDRVRVSTQLIDPRTDSHLWAETFDRELTDIFRVQEEIARQVSNALLRHVAGLRPRAAGSRTDRTAAYDAYLRGTFASQRRSREGMLDAMAAFEEAIGLDSTYAPAYAGLATSHALWVVFGYRGERSAYSHIVRALALADRAVALDSSLAEAYAARGGARRQALMPVQSVLADVRRAARLAPNAGEVRAMHGLGLAYAGDFEAAVREAESAVALDPLSPGRRSALATTLYAARRHEDALREARRASSLAPGFPLPLRQQAQALLLLGRYQECATMDVGPYLAFRAMCRWSAGARAEAAAIVDSLAAAIAADADGSAIEAGVLAGEIANYYAWVGDAERTIHWLRRAAEASPQVPFQLTMEGGLYDRVLEMPRFRSEWDRIRREIRARVEGAEQ